MITCRNFPSTFFFLAAVTRRELGLPDSWTDVAGWLTPGDRIGLPLVADDPPRTNRFIGLNFRAPFPKAFWEDFPRAPLPTQPGTKIDTAKFKLMTEKAGSDFTVHEKDRALRATTFLMAGAPSYQLHPLPGVMVKNAESVFKHGAHFTATLESWIQAGFVAGPFSSPPLANFRSNSLMAEEQGTKVRPVLNMSSPKGASFNSNVDADALPRVHMSSAVRFARSVVQAGRAAVMSKMDMKDAYKLIPARIDDLRLQGFSWGGHSSPRRR